MSTRSALPRLNRQQGRVIFKQMVTAQLEEGVLRFSRRRQLVKYARKLNISPFEANLVIAEAQYEAGHLIKPDAKFAEELTYDAPADLKTMARPGRWPIWFKLSIALIAAILIDLVLIQTYFR
jgi:hypothetical protein